MTNKKQENKIIFICWLSYTVAYIGRLNFNASIVAVVDQLGVTKAEAGLVGSFFFFAYGIGQLVNGVLSKRYNPKIMIFISLSASAFLNVLMPLMGDISIMKYIWLLNGAVQSILWCTLIKTLSIRISDKNMPRAIVMMSTTTPIGTFSAYGLSALFVKLGSWKTTFFIAGALLIVTAFVWLTLYGESKKKACVTKNIEVGTKEKAKVKAGKAVIFALIITALAGIANGFIKDGVTTWVSSLLYEEFNISQAFSIMLTLLLPLVATVAAAVVKKTHEKISSHTTLNFMLFGVASVFCIGILFSLKIHSFPLIMVCFMAVAFIMAGVNNVITSIFPLDNRNLIDAGFCAGFLNTFCYVGSSITSYALGSIAENAGWNITFAIMLAVALTATIVCSVGFVNRRIVTSD